MTVSLWIRETVGSGRRFVKPNKKKIYPEGTVFCLRYTADGKRRWETLRVNTLTRRAYWEGKQGSSTSIASSPSCISLGETDQVGGRHRDLSGHGRGHASAQDVVGIQPHAEYIPRFLLETASG